MGLLDFLFGKEFSIKRDYKLMNNMFSENLKHLQNKNYVLSIVLLSKMIHKAKEMQSKLNEDKPIQYTYENISFDIVELYYLRATSKMTFGHSDALNDFNTALAINPEHIESLYNRAVLYTNINKDVKKALADISKCLKLQPNNKDYIQFQEGLINLEKELSKTQESKKSVKSTKKKTPSMVQKASNNLKEVKGKLAEDVKKDSKEITDLLKKFHSIHIQQDVNNIEEQIDLLDKIIPLIEKVQIPLYETYKKNSDPDPEHGYSACLITYADKELTFKYHYCELLYHRGTFKAMKGDVSAINDFEQSSEIVKEESTLLNLCLAYGNLAHDIGKSINCITECVELFPNSTRAKKFQLKILEAVEEDKSEATEEVKSVNYDFSDTLIFFNLAEEHFPNNQVLSKSKRNFSKIYINSDFKNLKKEFANREGKKISTIINVYDPTQKIEIKTFWKGSSYKSKVEGYFEVYREDGSLFMKINEVNNMTHGKRTIFDVNGNVFEESMVIEGEEFGFKILNNFEEEGFNRIEMYDRDESTGIVRGYYSDGEIYFEEEYLKGGKKGVWKEWYQNGKIKWEREYNGLLDGVYNEYYENGNPKEIGNFKKSMRSGDWKEYDTKGNLTMSEKWEPTDKDVSKCLERKCFNEKGEEVDCPELTNIRKTFTQQ